ncbi:MAG TPA: YceI family protein [Acidimicrobiia bacterium]
MITKTSTAPPGTRPGKPWRRLLIGLVVVAVVGAAGLYWFLGGEAPAEVDLTETVSAIGAGAATTLTDAAETGVEGSWLVDTSVGEFSPTEDTTATFAGFRVEEVLTSVGSATAVGRSPEISGSAEIDGTTLTSAEIVVDMTSIVSDESRRDDAIQRALGTGANPTASFVLTEPIELGDGAVSGEPVSVTASGRLTVNGVTNDVEIPLEAQLVDGMILVTGAVDILFSDYEVTAPSAPVVVSVEDNGILELQIWLSR